MQWRRLRLKAKYESSSPLIWFQALKASRVNTGSTWGQHRVNLGSTRGEHGVELRLRHPHQQVVLDDAQPQVRPPLHALRAALQGPV